MATQIYRHPRADKKDYEILFTFRILHDGWEMDNEAWVARNKKGKLVLLMTSHGGLYDYGRDVSELHEVLEQTKRSLAGIKQAIALINSDAMKPKLKSQIEEAEQSGADEVDPAG